MRLASVVAMATQGATAFVLTGGASLGAVQVGMAQALLARGIVPDLLVGTSVGAVNAAFLAGRCDEEGAEALAELWRGLDRDDVFPTDFALGLAGFVGRRDHLVPNGRLRKLIEAHQAFERIEDAPVPLHVVTTDLLTGAEVLLSSGPLADAVLASAAIPGVFPPVRLGDRWLVDGGVVNNAPVSQAVALGATQIWVLPPGYTCSLGEPPKGALAVALQALTLLVHQRLAVDVAHYRGDAEVRVVPSLCPMIVSPTDFSKAPSLIRLARAQTEAWIDAGAVGDELSPPLGHRH